MTAKISESTIEILTESYKNITFQNNDIVELDIGCGKGSFTSALAQMYPDRQIIAADVMIGRLRKLDKRNKRLNINNIHLIRAEAWHFICSCIPDKSITRIHILCPDPWPKIKHKAHRLISSEFIGRLSKKLKKNGILHFSTDDTEYYNSSNKIIHNTGLFIQNDHAIDDIQGIKSDFEKHWEEMDCKVNHIAWILK